MNQQPAQQNPKYAYFSMEVGLTAKIPTYSGGLGVLAGDTLKTAADIGFPMIGVTLLTKNGYFFQDIENNQQVESPMSWSIDDFLTPIPEKVKVIIKGEEVTIGAWKYEIVGIHNEVVPVLFLHTDFEENSPEMRALSNDLYGDGPEYRLGQEIILGIGGVRMLKKLGYKDILKYHLNEGHSALLSLELNKTIKNPEKVKEMCIFTTHTPVPAGHDKFSISLVEDMLEPELFVLLPSEFVEKKTLNMTQLALDFSGYINGVAQKHTEVSKSMFPNYPIHSITNGVHAPTWVSASFANLFDKYIHHWREDPYSLRYVSNISLSEIWDAHFQAKKRIIDYTNAHTNAGMDYDFFTIGWARRFTAYKRPGFLFEDVERLKTIAELVGPIQIIFGGKAHPKDTEGKELITKILEMGNKIDGKIKMAYLENYDMYLGQLITAGVDVWLNTPEPPYEASGTSGMKCALNGVPHLSVRDGWWVEGCIEGETGWSFPTSDDLYDLLEKKVIPMFYKKPDSWRNLMRKTIIINGSFFNSTRMLHEYRHRAYDA
ncbi:alpha-glucan family phosphorylase [Patescibacteria group bacterium]|nr:alpha-glucan family phosphorylase [Patescibacteria group bacterium]